MNFANVAQLTTPRGEVYQILRGGMVLWTKPGEPTPPGQRLTWLQNGSGSSPSRAWSIDTGITWRNVFLNSSSLGISNPGLETEVIYSYSTVPPEGGLFAGCNPRSNQAGGGGYRDQGGFWRIFGHGGSNFCFDCPSEDDRNELEDVPAMVAETVYTETCKYGYLRGNTLESYLKVESEGSTVGENYRSEFGYSWQDAALPHNLYLWADNSQTSGDIAPLEGVRIYGFTVWYLQNGTRHTKVYEGVPWLDSNGVACILDLVSNQLQYNCASGGASFLYS